MVRHVLFWQLRDELSEKERAEVAASAKRALEALVGVVPGLISLSVTTTPMESSNVELMLDSTLESPAAYDGYKVHPAHVAAAGIVRAAAKSRYCMDFEF